MEKNVTGSGSFQLPKAGLRDDWTSQLVISWLARGLAGKCAPGSKEAYAP